MFLQDQKPPAWHTLLYNQQALKEIIKSVQRGLCCRVLGPPYRAKSQLMREASRQLKTPVYYTSYQSLKDIDLSNEARFFLDLFSRIKNDIPNDLILDVSSFQNVWGFQFALHKLLLNCDRNIVIFLDDIEIVPPNLAALLLVALRKVYSISVDQNNLRLQAVICGSLNLNKVALKNASRFEDISTLIFVDNLNFLECERLLKEALHKSNLKISKKSISLFLEYTGCDPLLIDLLLSTLLNSVSSPNLKNITCHRINKTVNLFLDEQKKTADSRIQVFFHKIESDTELLTSFLKILKLGTVDANLLPMNISSLPTDLDLCGVFRRENNSYRLKCKLWKELLDNYFTHERIARHFSMKGNSKEAINHYKDHYKDYYPIVAKRDDPGIRFDVQTSVLNSLHSMTFVPPLVGLDFVREAFSYIAVGLHYLSGCDEILLYYRENDNLVKIYPQNEEGDMSVTHDLGFKETMSLDGLDYSIVPDPDKHRVVAIPLRSQMNDKHPIGLAVIKIQEVMDNPYQQRKTIEQLVEFIHLCIKTFRGKIYLVQVEHINLRVNEMINGFIHSISKSIANIPDLVDEIETNLQSEKSNKNPMIDLKRCADEAYKLTEQLQNFVITGEPKLDDISLFEVLEKFITAFQKRNLIDIKFLPKGDKNIIVQLDPNWFELVLTNLLQNAIEAKDETRALQIEIKYKTSKNNAIIQIVDNGKGIRTEEIPYIFNFGYSTKRKKGLAGVGLRHCKQIIETTFHGKIGVTSKFGNGTTFTIKLPIYLPDS